MSCHVVREHAAAGPAVLTLRAHPLRIALVGQPNVGKSVVFGRLTGRYVTVSNYPGTTVAVTKGRALVGAEVCDVIDTPGVNALEGAVSEDERITREVLTVERRRPGRAGRRRAQPAAGADAHGADRRVRQAGGARAQHGRRGLRARHLHRRARRSSTELGHPVVEMVAVDGRGLAELRDALRARRRARAPARPDAARARRLGARADRSACAARSTLSLARIPEVLARATRRPLTGLPILAVVLYALYLFVGVFGAQTLVKLLEDGVFGRGINPAAIWLADRFIPFPLVRDFLVGEYGLITMGADLRHRDRPAGGRDLLPDVRLSRGQRLHPAPRDLLRSHLPRHGAQRQGGAADGARPRLRHHGDDDDADSGDAEGAADRDPAARARHPVLGAARHDPRHPRRRLVRGADHAVRRRARRRCSWSAGWRRAC